MNSRVRHPRLLAVSRTLLYLAMAIAVSILVGATVLFLGALALFGTVSLLLVGDVSELAVLVAGGLGLFSLGLVGAALVTATKRADRFMLERARIPSPLETVQTKYVRGDIDEGELERLVEQVLTIDSDVARPVRRFVSPVRIHLTRAPSRGSAVELNEELA